MDPGIVAGYFQVVRATAPGLPVDSFVLEGEGDFCRAFTVDRQWIFRFAYNDAGSKAVELEARLLPVLCPAIDLPVPNIQFSGRQPDNGFAFAGYPKVPGVPLTFQMLDTMAQEPKEQAAVDLAHFLRQLHSFSPDLATRLGVAECHYPFCRAENGILQGTPSELYSSDLERLGRFPLVDQQTRRGCAEVARRLLDASNDLPPCLIHGDLSSEHVLYDPEAGQITGVIDFSDVLISTPLLDFMYLWESYGDHFTSLLLGRYLQAGTPAPEHVIARIRLLHVWHAVLRLLWALEHDYAPGVEYGMKELVALLAGNC